MRYKIGKCSRGCGPIFCCCHLTHYGLGPKECRCNCHRKIKHRKPGRWRIIKVRTGLSY